MQLNEQQRRVNQLQLEREQLQQQVDALRLRLEEEHRVCDTLQVRFTFISLFYILLKNALLSNISHSMFLFAFSIFYFCFSSLDTLAVKKIIFFPYLFWAHGRFVQFE